ncbi:hypothetical protein BDN72DRAFT_750788, partial [Pluteus cervinus]
TNGVYRVVHPVVAAANAAITTTTHTYSSLHRAMGHTGLSYIKHMVANNMIEGVTISKRDHGENSSCGTCLKAKIRRSPVEDKRVTPAATSYGEHFHIDIWGPATVQTTGHHRYALTVLD